MQQIGFLMDFILFVIPAFHFKHYQSAAGIHSFQAMYFLSSFFNQFGPNAVTFLVAAEVYPTPVRATAHGFSAAIGKCGALFASVIYNYIPDQTKFYMVPWFGLVGMLVTALFLPDTTGLDLKEQERRWNYIRAGRSDDYHGVAVHAQHLSLWERLRGQGKHYDPELDHQDRIADMRADWEASESEKQNNENGLADVDDTEFTDEVHHYFRSTTTSPVIQNLNKQKAVSSENSEEFTNEKIPPPAAQ